MTAPFDFWADFAPPAMPIGAMPRILEDFAHEQAELTGLDPVGLSVAAIASCAAAISNRIILEVDDRRESARFWGMLVGGSDCDANRIMKIAVEPLRKVEDRYRREYDDQMIDGVDPDEGRFYRKRILLEGVFLHAIHAVMRRAQGEGLLVTHEEIGRDVMFDKARPLYVRAYDGGPNVWDSDQDDRGTFDLPFCSMSLLGGLNPTAPKHTWDEDLFSRMMPINLLPQNKAQPGQAPVTQHYSRLIEDLSELETVRFETRNWEQAQLRFSTVGRYKFESIEHRYNEYRSLDFFNPRLGALFARYPIVFLRLCVIFHCIEHVGDPHLPVEISAATAHRAKRFMEEVLEPNAITFFSRHIGLPDLENKLRFLALHVLSRQLTRIRHKELRPQLNQFRNMKKEEFMLLMRQLEALNWVTINPDETATVNPLCHELYKRQGDIERTRRERLLTSWRAAAERKRRLASD